MLPMRMRTGPSAIQLPISNHLCRFPQARRLRQQIAPRLATAHRPTGARKPDALPNATASHLGRVAYEHSRLLPFTQISAKMRARLCLCTIQGCRPSSTVADAQRLAARHHSQPAKRNNRSVGRSASSAPQLTCVYSQVPHFPQQTYCASDGCGVNSCGQAAAILFASSAHWLTSSM